LVENSFGGCCESSQMLWKDRGPGRGLPLLGLKPAPYFANFRRSLSLDERAAAGPGLTGCLMTNFHRTRILFRDASQKEPGAQMHTSSFHEI
jgi:hypothetical protein